jgi:hypothetical protein
MDMKSNVAVTPSKDFAVARGKICQKTGFLLAQEFVVPLSSTPL